MYANYAARLQPQEEKSRLACPALGREREKRALKGQGHAWGFVTGSSLAPAWTAGSGRQAPRKTCACGHGDQGLGQRGADSLSLLHPVPTPHPGGAELCARESPQPLTPQVNGAPEALGSAPCSGQALSRGPAPPASCTAGAAAAIVSVGGDGSRCRLAWVSLSFSLSPRYTVRPFNLHFITRHGPGSAVEV